MIKNHNPNEHWGRKTVQVTFMLWDYSLTMEATVGGNCLGFDNIETAIGSIYDDLPSDHYGATSITFKRADGDTLLCCDEEDRGEDWLKDMVVAAEIVAVSPDARVSR